MKFSLKRNVYMFFHRWPVNGSVMGLGLGFVLAVAHLFSECAGVFVSALMFVMLFGALALADIFWRVLPIAISVALIIGGWFYGIALNADSPFIEPVSGVPNGLSVLLGAAVPVAFFSLLRWLHGAIRGKEGVGAADGWAFGAFGAWVGIEAVAWGVFSVFGLSLLAAFFVYLNRGVFRGANRDLGARPARESDNGIPLGPFMFIWFAGYLSLRAYDFLTECVHLQAIAL